MRHIHMKMKKKPPRKIRGKVRYYDRRDILKNLFFVSRSWALWCKSFNTPKKINPLFDVGFFASAEKKKRPLGSFHTNMDFFNYIYSYKKHNATKMSWNFKTYGTLRGAWNFFNKATTHTSFFNLKSFSHKQLRIKCGVHSHLFLPRDLTYGSNKFLLIFLHRCSSFISNLLFFFKAYWFFLSLGLILIFLYFLFFFFNYFFSNEGFHLWGVDLGRLVSTSGGFTKADIFRDLLWTHLSGPLMYLNTLQDYLVKSYLCYYVAFEEFIGNTPVIEDRFTLEYVYNFYFSGNALRMLTEFEIIHTLMQLLFLPEIFIPGNFNAKMQTFFLKDYSSLLTEIILGNSSLISPYDFLKDYAKVPPFLFFPVYLPFFGYFDSYDLGIFLYLFYFLSWLHVNLETYFYAFCYILYSSRIFFNQVLLNFYFDLFFKPAITFVMQNNLDSFFDSFFFTFCVYFYDFILFFSQDSSYYYYFAHFFYKWDYLYISWHNVWSKFFVGKSVNKDALITCWAVNDIFFEYLFLSDYLRFADEKYYFMFVTEVCAFYDITSLGFFFGTSRHFREWPLPVEDPRSFVNRTVEAYITYFIPFYERYMTSNFRWVFDFLFDSLLPQMPTDSLSNDDGWMGLVSASETWGGVVRHTWYVMVDAWYTAFTEHVIYNEVPPWSTPFYQAEYTKIWNIVYPSYPFGGEYTYSPFGSKEVRQDRERVEFRSSLIWFTFVLHDFKDILQASLYFDFQVPFLKYVNFVVQQKFGLNYDLAPALTYFEAFSKDAFWDLFMEKLGEAFYAELDNLHTNNLFLDGFARSFFPHSRRFFWDHDFIAILLVRYKYAPGFMYWFDLFWFFFFVIVLLFIYIIYMVTFIFIDFFLKRDLWDLFITAFYPKWDKRFDPVSEWDIQDDDFFFFAIEVNTMFFIPNCFLVPYRTALGYPKKIDWNVFTFDPVLKQDVVRNKFFLPLRGLEIFNRINHFDIWLGTRWLWFFFFLVIFLFFYFFYLFFPHPVELSVTYSIDLFLSLWLSFALLILVGLCYVLYIHYMRLYFVKSVFFSLLSRLPILRMVLFCFLSCFWLLSRRTYFFTFAGVFNYQLFENTYSWVSIREYFGLKARGSQQKVLSLYNSGSFLNGVGYSLGFSFVKQPVDFFFLLVQNFFISEEFTKLFKIEQDLFWRWDSVYYSLFSRYYIAFFSRENLLVLSDDCTNTNDLEGIFPLDLWSVSKKLHTEDATSYVFSHNSYMKGSFDLRNLYRNRDILFFLQKKKYISRRPIYEFYRSFAKSFMQNPLEQHMGVPGHFITVIESTLMKTGGIDSRYFSFLQKLQESRRNWVFNKAGFQETLLINLQLSLEKIGVSLPASLNGVGEDVCFSSKSGYFAKMLWDKHFFFEDNIAFKDNYRKLLRAKIYKEERASRKRAGLSFIMSFLYEMKDMWEYDPLDEVMSVYAREDPKLLNYPPHSRYEELQPFFEKKFSLLEGSQALAGDAPDLDSFSYFEDAAFELEFLSSTISNTTSNLNLRVADLSYAYHSDDGIDSSIAEDDEAIASGVSSSLLERILYSGGFWKNRHNRSDFFNKKSAVFTSLEAPVNNKTFYENV